MKQQVITAPRVSFRPEELSALLKDDEIRRLTTASIGPEGVLTDGLTSRVLSSLLLTGAQMASAAKNALWNAAQEGNSEARAILRAYCGHSCLYPGSFDPFTLGHRDLVERSLNVFDDIVVAVGVNSSKSPIFSQEERIALIKKDLEEFGDRVKVMGYSNTLVEFCDKNNIKVVVRGVRSITDWNDELSLARYNFDHSHEQLETMMMPAREGGSYVSSSAVKEVAKRGRALSKFLSSHIEMALKKKLGLPEIPGSEAVHPSLKPYVAPLQMRWAEITSGLGLTADTMEKNFDDVLNFWCGAKRSYHTIRHLSEMLDWIDAHGSGEEKKILSLAAFGHDLIQLLDPDHRDDEELSAGFFDNILAGMGVDSETRKTVSGLILATKGHRQSSDRLTSLFLDADLSILAAPRARYAEYCTDVAREYLNCISPERYISGRKAFLKSMIERKRIFSSFDSPELESAANENMKFELELLEKCPALIIEHGSIGTKPSRNRIP